MRCNEDLTRAVAMGSEKNLKREMCLRKTQGAWVTNSVWVLEGKKESVAGM